MPKVSKKRLKDSFEEADQGILAHFGIEDDKPGQKTQEKAGDQTDVAALREQIAEMQRNMEQMQRTNLALMSQPPVVPANVVRETPKEPDFGDLPDPTLDREAFDKALRDRVNAMVTNQVQAVKGTLDSARTQEQQADQLWSEFSSSYDAYAEDQDKVEFAAAKVANEMRARGVDVQKYMFQARDQFFKDVAQKYDTMFGKPGSEDNDQDDDAEEESQRTAGIFGGVESGGRPSQVKESPGDMVKDIHDIQRRSGFF